MCRVVPSLAALLALSSISVPAMAGPLATASAYTSLRLMGDGLSDLSFTLVPDLGTTTADGVTTSVTADGNSGYTFQVTANASQSLQHVGADLFYDVFATNTSDHDVSLIMIWAFSAALFNSAQVDDGTAQTASFASKITGLYVSDSHSCSLPAGGGPNDIRDQGGVTTCVVSAGDESQYSGYPMIPAHQTVELGYGDLIVSADVSVPEPATISLLGFSVMAVGAIRRRHDLI